jgi:hypothetical protein
LEYPLGSFEPTNGKFHRKNKTLSGFCCSFAKARFCFFTQNLVI